MKYFIQFMFILSILLTGFGCTSSSQTPQVAEATIALDASAQTNTPDVETSTPTPFSTPTLYPALNSEDAYELVFQLLKDNSNCKLPCWWGITPNETTSQDAISFLNSFSLIASTYSMRIDRGGMILQVPNGDDILSPYIGFNSIDGIITTLTVGVSQISQNEGGGYDQVYDDPAFINSTHSLMLPEILKLYGPPKEVLIATYSLQPLGWPAFFEIQLFYPNHGFLIVYYTLMEFAKDEYIQGCPSKGNIGIGLWESEKYASIKDIPNHIRENISGFSLSSYLQIDKATNMSIENFYNTFKNDNGTLCLETPYALWPFPGQ